METSDLLPVPVREKTANSEQRALYNARRKSFRSTYFSRNTVEGSSIPYPHVPSCGLLILFPVPCRCANVPRGYQSVSDVISIQSPVRRHGDMVPKPHSVLGIDWTAEEFMSRFKNAAHRNLLKRPRAASGKPPTQLL